MIGIKKIVDGNKEEIDMKTFEDCLAFIENQLGVHLLLWQKEALRLIYEHERFYLIPNARCGKAIFVKAAQLLKEINKEN